MLGVMLAMVAGAAPAAVPPRPTPPVYATHNYGLTFRSPAHGYYCPLPKDWVGSDHGTTIFLDQHVGCSGGAGYPSTSRGFTANVPRIEIFYVYRADDDPKMERCRTSLHIRLLGTRRPICRSREGRLEALKAQAFYGKEPSEVDVRLVTTRARLAGDLLVMRQLVRSLRECRDGDVGRGAPCPRAGWY